MATDIDGLKSTLRRWTLLLGLIQILWPARRLGAGEIWSDPPPAVRPAASMEEIAITSHGDRMNGFVYLAAGGAAHPVVIFLHGYPGNERNLDLAQAVRRAGFQAVFFDYRGTWGSAGTFSFAHGLEDLDAVLDWVRAPVNAAKYRFDPRRVAIVGHSYGGWVALMSAGHESPGVCVGALAAWNLGWAAQRFAAHPDERGGNLDYFRVTADPAGGPVHASPGGLLDELSAHADSWDYLAQAASLKDRALFLAAASHDTPDEDVAMHRRLAERIREAGGRRVRLVTYDDDHPFSSHRVALAETLVDWLRGICASTWREASTPSPGP
jgi:alpha/beta superfamily hydrolase